MAVPPQVVISTAVREATRAEPPAAAGLPIPTARNCCGPESIPALHLLWPAAMGKTTTSTWSPSPPWPSRAKDPTAVIGGMVFRPFRSNARSPGTRLLVAEADESDGFASSSGPALGLITNLELDHTDHYPNLEAFSRRPSD